MEDAIWGFKQRFQLEQFLVRSWHSIRRLIGLVAVAFYWLNLWGEDHSQHLCAPLIHHSWRLRKRIAFLLDWLATQIHYMLHPKPKFTLSQIFGSG